MPTTTTELEIKVELHNNLKLVAYASYRLAPFASVKNIKVFHNGGDAYNIVPPTNCYVGRAMRALIVQEYLRLKEPPKPAPKKRARKTTKRTKKVAV